MVRNERAVLLLGIAAFFLAVLWNATVREDAYITFRVVDNFVNGYGLRWNIDERVQAYTNPLWMLLHIPFYFVWRDIYFITLGLSLLCTWVAIMLPLRTFQKPPLTSLCIFIIPLAVSSTFTEFSTSGLENPLNHVLFAFFGWAILRAPQKHLWLFLSLATSLSFVNRLDTVMFYGPIWAFLIATRFRDINWKQCIIGALPIVVWECFSLFYYGFLFPNTRYAKLGTGVPWHEHLWQGCKYFFNLAAIDVVGALFLVAACVSLLPLAVRYAKTRSQETGALLAIAAGLGVFTLYVINVGGNQTPGRFWSLHVYTGVWLMLALLNPKRLQPMAVAAALFIFIRIFYPSAMTLSDYCATCFSWTASLQAKDKVGLVSYLRGEVNLPTPRTRHLKEAGVRSAIGRYGFQMDPETKLIDKLGLADALLARLPSKSQHMRGMGRFQREIPRGYMYAATTGDSRYMDRDLAVYYDKLRLIISGDLLSGERLKEILRFNLGDYNHYRDAYVAKARQAISLRQNPSGQSISETD